MNDQKYIEPELEVIMLGANEVVTTSGGSSGGGIVLPDDEW